MGFTLLGQGTRIDNELDYLKQRLSCLSVDVGRLALACCAVMISVTCFRSPNMGQDRSGCGSAHANHKCCLLPAKISMYSTCISKPI